MSGVKAALRSGWDTPPSLATHAHTQRWLSRRERQKKRETGRAEKSPESERTRAPQGGSAGPAASEPCGRPADLHRRLHTWGWPGEAAKPHLCACSFGGELSCPGQDSCLPTASSKWCWARSCHVMGHTRWGECGVPVASSSVL